MSSKQHHDDSSLNNQPERDAAKLANAGFFSTSTDVSGSARTGEGSSGSETVKSDVPLDKHGDTFENKQVK